MPFASAERARQHRRDYYQRNRAKYLAKAKAYGQSERGKALINARRADPPKRIRHLALQARRRAALAGFAFDDAVFDLANNPPMACACCQKRLDYSVGRGQGRHRDSPSLDRVDNRFGYTAANTRVICMECNTNKSDLSLAELRRLVRYVEGHSWALL